MTLQEIFDKSASGLLAQGERSSLNGTCLYRSFSGHKCAIGWLIPDAVYSEAIEGKSVKRFSSEFFAKCGIDIEQEPRAFSLMIALQRVHDTELVPNWPEKLAHVAKRFELSPAVLERRPT